ncbi:MAG TPA: hypothetical protein VFO19_21490 [Vicinamibacterales bacterium]|jgi:hypothetical protein|nr:hypothetical protein [Vicinamibacterales bacterium]
MRTAMIVLLFVLVAGYTAAFATARHATPVTPAAPERPLGPIVSPGAAQFLLEIR